MWDAPRGGPERGRQGGGRSRSNPLVVEIRRPVDWIDIDDGNAILCVPVANRSLALDRVGGKGRAQRVDDDPLDGNVNLGLIIPRRFRHQFANGAAAQRAARFGASLKDGFGQCGKARRSVRCGSSAGSGFDIVTRSRQSLLCQSSSKKPPSWTLRDHGYPRPRVIAG